MHWSFWAALTVPVLVCLPLYISLARIFSAFSRGTDFVFFNRATWPRVLEFYGFLILPCSAVILLALASRPWQEASSNTIPVDDYSPVTLQDFVLTLGFIALPVFGLLMAQFVHSPYFSRYFLPAVLGVCIAFVIAAGNRHRWVCRLLLELSSAGWA